MIFFSFFFLSYELPPGLQTEDATLMAMNTLVDQLVDMGVGLVACQKVIHPSVKRRLRQKGLLAIDRLSMLHIGAVQQVTGICWLIVLIFSHVLIFQDVNSVPLSAVIVLF